MSNARSIGSSSGFTLVEVLIVVALVGIVAAMALPETTSTMRAYRLKGDAQSLNNLVALTKMRAASQFSRARVYADLNANTFQMQVWNKTAGAWNTEGGVYQLSQGVRFGFAGLGAPPPNTQAAIGQSPLCKDAAGNDIAGTACIAFNSRGMPVNNALPPAGAVVGNSALYITDGSSVYGTTVTTTPLIKFWWSPAANVAWKTQ